VLHFHFLSLLTDIFRPVFSSGSNDPSLELSKDKAEALLPNFVSQLREPYNASFNVDKLFGVLDHCCSMSAGADGIHNQVLFHLPSPGKEFPLPVYGHI
jgi:hypothetical protein